MNKSKIFFLIGGIAIVCLAFYGLGILFQELFIKNYVVPLPGVEVEVYIDDFMYAVVASSYVTGVFCFLWIVLGQWVFRIKSWGASGKRIPWIFLFVSQIISVVEVGIIYIMNSQEGGKIVWLYYIISFLLAYYISTALFSSSSFKYTPVGSRKLRPRWW
jgi:hypothetical protein